MPLNSANQPTVQWCNLCVRCDFCNIYSRTVLLYVVSQFTMHFYDAALYMCLTMYEWVWYSDFCLGLWKCWCELACTRQF